MNKIKRLNRDVNSYEQITSCTSYSVPKRNIL
ncbi:hypothetical protein Xenpb_02431 [Xenorhabdus sp. PB62.4]|nr:hypothetical protein [Xenorhabdus sp. PB62.4]